MNRTNESPSRQQVGAGYAGVRFARAGVTAGRRRRLPLDIAIPRPMSLGITKPARTLNPGTEGISFAAGTSPLLEIVESSGLRTISGARSTSGQLAKFRLAFLYDRPTHR